MNRFLLMFAVALLFCTSILFSQEDDEPLSPPKRAGSTKIGGAGGFTQGWLGIDVGPINQMLKGQGLADFNKGNLFMLGGEGYGYILLVPNLRIGGIGMSGSVTSKTVSGNVVREVKLSAGYGGVTMEYTIPLVPRLDISVGVMLGGGGIDLNFSRSSGVAQQWQPFLAAFGSGDSVNDYSAKLSGSFFVYQPTLTAEYAVLRWLGIKAGVSYVGMSGPTWKRDDKFDFYGVPSNVNGQGWSFNTGILIGTFVF